MDKKKILTMVTAALAVGFGGATLNFNYMEASETSESDIKRCLVVIDNMIKTHSGDLSKVASMIAATDS